MPLDGRRIHRQDGAYAAVMPTDADECAFDQLVVDAQIEAVSVDGWDFSWLGAPGGLSVVPVGRLRTAAGTLDVQTGDSEVPAGTGRPSVLVATEPWSPNPDRATWLLNPLGAGAAECVQREGVQRADELTA
ncbi:hypothetical protein [Kitasatospora sp. NPDC056800]|uniref:hypothetical protein n=1 Tax=Kitasatospora sp. NPDC056800 TaxID=3345948 RepID=UPI0036B6600F